MWRSIWTCFVKPRLIWIYKDWFSKLPPDARILKENTLQKNKYKVSGENKNKSTNTNASWAVCNKNYSSCRNTQSMTRPTQEKNWYEYTKLIKRSGKSFEMVLNLKRCCGCDLFFETRFQFPEKQLYYNNWPGFNLPGNTRTYQRPASKEITEPASKDKNQNIAKASQWHNGANRQTQSAWIECFCLSQLILESRW